MGMLIQAARDARYVRAVADVLHGNEAMVALGRAHDFAVVCSPHGSTMLRLVRDLHGPAPASRVRFAAGGAPQTGLTAAFAAFQCKRLLLHSQNEPFPIHIEPRISS